ncbi:MAG TPA: helix-turn-helix transcriptional regulator [Actinocrinis sp.]|nr:helix-turn-helix transcriptional regulator [Actinocrinis sp.]
MSSFDRARESLGRRLRELREQTGLNGKQFAEALGWQATKVSRLENGQRTPSRSDITAWAEAADAVAVTDELLTLTAALDEMYATWKRQLKAGFGPRQRKSLEAEGQTRFLRGFQCSVVPGLVQTPDYARRVFEHNSALHGFAQDIDDAVDIRMRRQQVLYESRQRLHLVMTEGALRHTTVTPHVMRAQLDRIISVSTLANVVLGVIPFDRQLPVLPLHGFMIYDEQTVRVETVTAELTVADPAEVQLYLKIFKALADAALYGKDLRTHLIELQAGLAD